MYKSESENVLPFLTAGFEGLGGIIKFRNEDFVVEEVPLYEASGEGTHVYAYIEKREIPTMEAIAAIGRALNIPRKDIGYAGLKDARAVARQWISVEHISSEKISGLDIPNIKIIQLARHSNKIKLGHLSRNRFSIKLRKFNLLLKEAEQVAGEVLSILIKKGVPNYFGRQRFGSRSDTHILGRAVSKGNIEEFMDIFLGKPDKGDPPKSFAARNFYDKGDYQKAVDSWPHNCADQRRALKAIINSKGNKKKGYGVVDKYLKSFFVSAYQSYLFNLSLAARMPNIDKLLGGDMAYKHVNGACFRVEDAEKEQSRCDAFEISPTGPMPGFRMTELTGAAGEIENTVLQQAGLTDRDFRQMKQFGAKGGRRPLRFQPHNASLSSGADDIGPYIEFRFELDSGYYATSVLREITKSDLS